MRSLAYAGLCLASCAMFAATAVQSGSVVYTNANCKPQTACVTNPTVACTGAVGTDSAGGNTTCLFAAAGTLCWASDPEGNNKKSCVQAATTGGGGPCTDSTYGPGYGQAVYYCKFFYRCVCAGGTCSAKGGASMSPNFTDRYCN